MIEKLLWLTILIGIEALSLCSLVAFTFTVLTWAGFIGGSF